VNELAGVWPQGISVGWSRSRGVAAAIVAALALPGLVTLLAFTTVSSATPRVLYIAAIAAAAAFGGRACGILAAVVSFVGFDYFFSPPMHSWSIGRGADIVSLVVFFVVGAGVGQLVARERRARRQAEVAGARARRLEAVAGALAHARTAPEVLDVVLSEGLAAAEAFAGLIGLVSEDGETIEVVAQRRFDHLDFDRWGRFNVADDLPLSETVRSGEPVYLASGAERDRRYPSLAGETEMSYALVCLPLRFEGRTIGGLVLSFSAETEFDQERRALEEALAAQAAAALDRARLNEAEHAARDSLSFLAEASELLASSLDYERTLSQLAELCVPRLADWCAIDMLAADGSIQRLAVAHPDPAKVRYAHELAERYPPDPDAPTGVANVLRTGEPEFLPEIPEELLTEATKGDEELLRIVQELGLHAAITVPLTARGRTLGALSLIAAETIRRYTEKDLQLALDLARRAAVAVDNARLHAESEQRAAAARALRQIAEAVVLVDVEGRLLYWNEAAANLLGGERLPAWQLLRPLLDKRGAEKQSAQLTVPIELDGWERWLQVSRVEFEEGCVFVLRDVTEERLLERTRSEFVATASHELRTPIASVYGIFQTLLRDDIDRDQIGEKFLRLGLMESQRLADIVDDLLLAGQLDAGVPKIELTGCDVGGLIAELVDATASRINGSHTLSATVEPNIAVRCDPLRLRQVLANLIENAIKYSPHGGTVAVAAAHPAGRSKVVRIEVKDEGIGIPEPEQARIFERFVRLDPAQASGVGGTGLGLYICRELVSRMHGRISVTSRKGAGSVFAIELPASDASTLPAASPARSANPSS
jgi:signal transduction histidine kinase